MNFKSQNYINYSRGLLLSLWTIFTAALVVFCIGTPVIHASDLILHPGYIDVSVSLPDPELPGGKHVITRITVTATGQDPDGNIYTSKLGVPGDSGQLTVEAGGWTYDIVLNAFIDHGYVSMTGSVHAYEGQVTSIHFETDGWIELIPTITGETVTAIDAGCQGNGSGASFDGIPGNSVRMPVNSGPEEIQIYSSFRVASGLGQISPPRLNTVVSAGEVSTVIWNTDPGYLAGQITLIGADINRAHIQVDTFDSANNKLGSAYIIVGPDGLYNFPVVPAEMVRIQNGFLYVEGGGTLFMDGKVFPLEAGQTEITDWFFDLSAEIAVSANIAGVNITEVYCEAELSFHHEKGITTNPSEPVVLDVFSGDWKVYSEIEENYVESDPGYRWFGSFRFPDRMVQVTPGERVELSFNMNPAILTGQVLAPESPGAQNLAGFNIVAERRDPIAGEFAQSIRNFKDTNPFPKDDRLKEYSLLADAGNWRINDIHLAFLEEDERGNEKKSWFRLDEYESSTGDYILPVHQVIEGQLSCNDLNLKMVKILINFSTATGDSFTRPSVRGTHLDDPDDIFDGLNFQIEGRSETTDPVPTDTVVVYTIPGIYRFSGEAMIDGSMTTFGLPFILNVDEGDEVVIDPDAPILVINSPEGNSISCDSTVAVFGAITDESGVASFTINGNAVAIGDDTFSHTLVNLPTGENVLEFVATDVEGNTIIVSRTIHVDALPVAVDDSYEVQENSLLTVAALGVLGNDYDADGDQMFVSSYTPPTNGSLVVNENGSFEYAPDIGFNGEDSFTYVVKGVLCDGFTGTVSLTVMPNNIPPVANAGSDRWVEATGELTPVLMDGTGSYDPDGDPLEYEWSPEGLFDDPTDPTPIGQFPVGPTLATLTVADGKGGIDCDDILVTVQDTTPPVLICTTDLIALWPPNKQVEIVLITVQVSDLVSDPENLNLVCKITSSEPDDGSGDGTTTGDVDGQDGYSEPVVIPLTYDGTNFVASVQLRAERDGSERGRDYTIVCEVTDDYGNTATASCVVVVPHDKRRK